MSALAKAKAVAETYHKTHATKITVPAQSASASNADNRKRKCAINPAIMTSHAKNTPSAAKPMYHDPKAGRVAFYGHRNDYGFLSNFYPTRFRLRGVRFDTSEQAIMYCKASLMGDKDSLEKLKAPGLDPKYAKALGRAVEPWKQELWDAEVRNIAFEVLMAKFSQNSQIAAWLEKTGNKRLVEAAPRDRIWGVGLNKSQVMAGAPLRGQNILGNTLERVRASLRNTRSNAQATAVDVASAGIITVILVSASNHSRRKIIKVQPPVFKLKYFQKKAQDKLRIKHAKAFVEAETNRILAPGDSLRNGVSIIVSK